MNLGIPFTRRPRSAAFTMIEVAISVAIIAFALVAIIGVLPAGLQVQKENREDTLLAQDGTYLIEAIRSGARGLDDLTNFVEEIKVDGVQRPFTSGAEIIGLLSRTGTVNTATIRAISGALSEKGSTTKDIAFRYQLQTQVFPFDPILLPNASLEEAQVRDQLSRKLYELRLLFKWPFISQANIGNSRQVLRATVSGDITKITNNGGVEYFFFQP